MKKKLQVLLAAVLSCAMLVTTAFASGTSPVSAAMSMEASTGGSTLNALNTGDEVTVAVHAPEVPMCALEFKICYDSNVFEYVSYATSGSEEESYAMYASAWWKPVIGLAKADEGEIGYAAADRSDLTPQNEWSILVLTLKVKDDAPSGETTISMTKLNLEYFGNGDATMVLPVENAEDIMVTVTDNTGGSTTGGSTTGGSTTGGSTTGGSTTGGSTTGGSTTGGSTTGGSTTGGSTTGGSTTGGSTTGGSTTGGSTTGGSTTGGSTTGGSTTGGSTTGGSTTGGSTTGGSTTGGSTTGGSTTGGSTTGGSTTGGSTTGGSTTGGSTTGGSTTGGSTTDEPTMYSVDVRIDGCGEASASPVSASAGTEIVLSATPQTGYHFKEWRVVDGSITIVGNKFTMPASNVVIEAVFEEDPSEPVEYTISFDVNGGTGSVAAQTTVDGKLTSLPTASRSGSYSFDGWYTQASGGEKITLQTVFTADMTVYAQWTYTGSSSGGGGGGGSSVSTYPITVDSAKKGDVTSSHKSAAKDTTVTLTVTPDKGYTLEDLTVTDASGNKVSVTEKSGGKYTFTMPASKVTVKAAFAEIEAENPFTDIPKGAYYLDAVLWAAENGITGGTDASHFSPDSVCTRAQAVTFLWRAAGSPAPKSSVNPFTDVAEGSYYYDAVLWAVEQGITKGTTADTFSPNATCTRAQIVTFLWRSQKSPAAGTANPFTDVAADAYYTNAVLWAAENGITGGTTATTFSPNNDCTRAQIVTFLFRYLSK